MIELKMYDRLHIQIVTDNRHDISAIKNYFTSHVEGYRFMPAFESGRWDGKICMFNSINGTLPYGLLTDLLSCSKQNNIEVKINQDVVDMFSCIKDPKIKHKLKIKPRDYQEECILACLKYGKGIIRSSTGSGKSLIIAYVINELRKLKKINKILIIVPTTNLVLQFVNDLVDYGFNQKDIGRVYEKYKEFDNPITISTWQSLYRKHEILTAYDCVICDEVHINKSSGNEVKKILGKCTSAHVRLGFTGTLPENKLEMWNIKSYAGPVLKEYTASELSKNGYISKCNIHAINIKYLAKYTGKYNEIKDSVFQNQYRLDLISHIIDSIDGNVLVLVGKVEKEGQMLKDFFEERNKDRETVFIWGKTKTEDREHWRKELEERKNIILIATYPIMQLGINIPSLKYVIFAAPFKSKIRVLQSVGRSLRLHSEKTKGSHIFDIIDHTKHLYTHGDKRIRYYYKEGFSVEEYDLKEYDPLENIFDKGKFL